jgi:DNA-binding PadR family transcriptional regulator
MFSDNSLLPKETIRLAALGILSEGPRAYADLANAVRQFVGRIAGPSLELTGPSIEMLRYEGLVEPVNEDTDPLLTLTAEGRSELLTLLQATVRPPLTDMSKLVIALKMRFLPLLTPDQRRDQADLLIDAGELELARLSDLRDPIAKDPYFQDWLKHDIDLVDSRLAWLRDFRDRV